MRTFARRASLVAIGLSIGCARTPRPPLRIAISPWPALELLYLAQEKGLFAEEGLSARLIEYSSPGDARRAFERGDVDGLGCTLAELLCARERCARGPVALLITDVSNGADAIVARAPIAAATDLAGRRVGVEISSIGPVLLARALEGAGLELRHVTLVPLEAGDVRRALAEGRVDAAVSRAPVAYDVLRDEANRTMFTSADRPGEVLRVVALDEDVVRGPDAPKLARAWDRALRFATEHPSEADAIMAGRERVAIDEFRDALDACRVLPLREQRPLFAADGALERALRDTDRILRAAGRLRGPDRTRGAASPSALTWNEVRD